MGMKSILPEWYGPDGDTLELIVQTGTIALDANVMLDLYRVGREQREQILSVLRRVSDRLFVPYQAALEFHRNRLRVVEDVEKLYKTLLEGIKFDSKHVDSLRDDGLQKQVRALLNDSTGTFKAGVEKLREEHIVRFDTVRDDDPVLDALEELLTEQTLGQRPSDEDLDERKALALDRIERRTPPGYEDANNKEDPTGDYLIWAELLEHFQLSQRPLLLVTNDQKEDWYRPRVRGQAIGPRTELILEMSQSSPDHPYHQVPLNLFLRLSNKYLETEVEDSTIETVESIARPVTISESKHLQLARHTLVERGWADVLAAQNPLLSVLSPDLASRAAQVSIVDLARIVDNLPSNVRTDFLQTPAIRQLLDEIQSDSNKRLLSVISPPDSWFETARTGEKWPTIVPTPKNPVTPVAATADELKAAASKKDATKQTKKKSAVQKTDNHESPEPGDSQDRRPR